MEVLGEEDDVFVLLVDEVVECGVEHADDFGGFVGDDGFVLFVVECGDGEAAGVVGVDGEIDVAKMVVLRVEWVRSRVLARHLFVGGCESPSWANSVTVWG